MRCGLWDVAGAAVSRALGRELRGSWAVTQRGFKNLPHAVQPGQPAGQRSSSSADAPAPPHHGAMAPLRLPLGNPTLQTPLAPSPTPRRGDRPLASLARLLMCVQLRVAVLGAARERIAGLCWVERQTRCRTRTRTLKALQSPSIQWNSYTPHPPAPEDLPARAPYRRSSTLFICAPLKTSCVRQPRPQASTAQGGLSAMTDHSLRFSSPGLYWLPTCGNRHIQTRYACAVSAVAARRLARAAVLPRMQVSTSRARRAPKAPVLRVGASQPGAHHPGPAGQGQALRRLRAQRRVLREQVEAAELPVQRGRDDHRIHADVAVDLGGERFARVQFRRVLSVAVRCSCAKARGAPACSRCSGSSRRWPCAACPWSSTRPCGTCHPYFIVVQSV
jgi:hypothetical protein